MQSDCPPRHNHTKLKKACKMPQERKRWWPYCKSGRSTGHSSHSPTRASVLLLGRKVNSFCSRRRWTAFVHLWVMCCVTSSCAV
eukprot:1154860-Pelagomonas_calceolata.AAC.4